MMFGARYRGAIKGACAWLMLLTSMYGPQVLAQSQIITFPDAIRIALERNITLREAQIDAMRADVDVSEAHMQFVPDLAAGATGVRSTGRSFNETEGRIVEATTQSLSLGVVSRITLFNGFHDIANLSRAKLSRQANDLELERMEETVIFAVADNFLELVIWQEQSRVQRESLAGEVQLEQQIQLYVEAGARAVADLYQQQVNVAAARVALIEAQSAAQLAEVELMRTLQLDPGGIYDFQPPTAAEKFTEPVELQDLLKRALANRDDLHAQEARLAATEQNVRMARSQYWPTLSLETGYGSDYTDASTVSFNDQLDRQRGGAVSLNVSIPIFDRQAARNASRRARLEVLSARVRFEEVRESVGLQVRQTYLNYQAARERFTAAEAQQRAAERAVQTAQERFKGGAYTLVELSESRADFVAAEGALARARALLNFQRMAIDYFVGDLDPAAFDAR